MTPTGFAAISVAVWLGACSSSDDEAAPPATITEASCTSLGGVVAPTSCPDDTEAIDARVDGQRNCCTPGGSLTVEQCDQIGGVTHLDPGDGSLRGCPAGTSTFASGIDGAIEGGFCCGR